MVRINACRERLVRTNWAVARRHTFAKEPTVMSYLNHWQLTRSPFANAGTLRDFFVGGTVEEAIARSEFLLNHQKRLGLVVGPSGAGKSSLFEYLSRRRSLSHPKETHIKIDLQSCTALGLSTRLHQALYRESSDIGSYGGTWTGRTTLDGTTPSRIHRHNERTWREIHDAIFSSAAIGQHPVFMFDQIETGTEEILESLRLLWSNRSKWSMLIGVDHEVLVNLPRWILESCELRIDLPQWDLGQTADYFDFALSKAGPRDDVFSGQAITRIQELSDGIPKRIAKLADLVLVAGAVRRQEVVTAELVDQVFDEFSVALGAKFPVFWEGQRLNAG